MRWLVVMALGGAACGGGEPGPCGGIAGVACAGRTVCPALERQYVSRDPDECAAIDFACEASESGFVDACGCGCTTRSAAPR
ncbi:MAG: hypothetical protein AAF602_15070 [Myxococcota bacterium]